MTKSSILLSTLARRKSKTNAVFKDKLPLESVKLGYKKKGKQEAWPE